MTQPSDIHIRIQVPDEAAVAPFGWLLGKPAPEGRDAVAFRSPGSDFWQEHVFQPGEGGETEVLWVKYRQADPVVSRLENHLLTQQAVVPVSGNIIQIVAASDASGMPDLMTACAFLLNPGQGLCMRPETWHATRAVDAEATCLMLTRRSTTTDLVHHLKHGTAITESRLTDIPKLHLTR